MLNALKLVGAVICACLVLALIIGVFLLIVGFATIFWWLILFAIISSIIYAAWTEEKPED